ncbi:MAG TPA: valine--tRNA ligase [Chloroflexota bacterium]|nr:valine--tRNA ligase [Chloroflexota bacterium]
METYAPYNPAETEAHWYDFWVAHDLFRPESHPNFGQRPPFVITMPPPNVTGGLHNGHTLFVALEDIMIRWHRMLGDPSLWVPGRDHAGIAGQLVVERDLKSRGLNRHDLGRDAFLDQMWEWMESYGLQIQRQLRRLGASADWSRDMFTMEPHHVRAVRTAFVRLYEKGLIYRGHRITNWCKDCQTVLSDLEVEYREVKGQLTYVRYPVVDAEGEWIMVATTRPETILGDVGVAVHPTDPRYALLVGKHVRIPHVNRIGVIVGDAAVDPEFGTGAVKITPAHDPTDFEIAQRHDLPAINVMNLDGTINAEGGAFVGLTTQEARKRIVAELEQNGQLVKQEAYTHKVGHCQRSGTVLEPLLLDQWYLRIKPLSDPAAAAVRDGRIRVIPERYARVYFNWMDNIRDWGISRQLWWGHRIPLYYCDAPGCDERWASVDEPERCRQCGSTLFHQDPDVLDTWFSSGLWPFSTLGWPDETRDLQIYYPTSVMETGHDILFFWVARMIMFGLEFTGQAPFHTVYLHGLIRAEGGVKMSKTKGNVQDPLELIDEYGTDALRLAVTIGITPGNDFTLTPTILDARRDFVNKLWNIGRFVMASTTPQDRRRAVERTAPKADAPLAERWISSRLSSVTADVTRMLGEFNFGEAARVIHDFIWDELADWYVEAFKVQSRNAGLADGTLLAQVFEKLLRLLHPFAPFVTEELWQRLTTGTPDRPVALMIADWPQPTDDRDLAAEADWSDIISLTRAVRTVRAEYHIEPAKVISATLVPSSPDRAAFWEGQTELLGALPSVRLRPIEVLASAQGAPTELAARSIATVAGGVELLIPAEGLFDVAAELARTEQEVADARKQVQRLESLLGSDFAHKAPPETVARERERLDEQHTRLQTLERRHSTLARLSGGGRTE